MAAKKKKADPNNKLIAENRRARYDYAIEDTVECGMMLMGSEVKSLRDGAAHITESYAAIEDGELWLINSYIGLYAQAKTFGHEERRRRKLLASKREIARMWQGIGRKGMTLVPLKLYFNDKGRAKLLLGLAKGKNQADKRETDKKRDWAKQKNRLLRDHG
ncbi:SsrA-binding protein SmpB [Amylibacter sp. IMCC11727]|uniref:SsrA-binding protein SmpB n=1 Tax=Amylibacter sp. IMCC11727 TaxID=3039851 RepID=UPI00244DE43D|nr:SsrA-binding protein SmpB [Amylibacter sp. IMCC11727]WGI22351.1 SsrA-binding protein SmpB [Amylibacter sp. IMCC11727]